MYTIPCGAASVADSGIFERSNAAATSRHESASSPSFGGTPIGCRSQKTTTPSEPGAWSRFRV